MQVSQFFAFSIFILPPILIVHPVKSVGPFSEESHSPGLCYGQASNTEEISHNFELQAVNATGQQCYDKIDWETIWMLQQKKHFNHGYANAFALLCPSWVGIKTCISDHLNKNCNGEEKRTLQDAMPLNLEIVIAEVLCEASWNGYFRSLLKQASKLGLWKCHGSNKDQCVGVQLQQNNGDWPTFSIFSAQYFKCMKLRFKNCAKDEEKLADLWSKMEIALQTIHEDLWDSYVYPNLYYP